MASRSPQTQLKRAREQAMREKRERKQAKKDLRAVEKRAKEDGTYVEPTEDQEDGGDSVAG